MNRFTCESCAVDSGRVIDPADQPTLYIYLRTGALRVMSPHDLAKEGGELQGDIPSVRELINELVHRPPAFKGPFHSIDVRG